MLLRRQNARVGGKLRAGHGSAYCAWGHAHLWIVANPLRLTHIAASHYVKSSVFFPKPDGRGHARAGLAERCKGNIFLTLDGGGNLTGHRPYLKMREPGLTSQYLPAAPESCPSQPCFLPSVIIAVVSNRLVANRSPGDCPSPVICVTSLNMRKWMRDRLQRRKKKSPEPGSQPAPPPLQPAYFDADQDSAPPESTHLASSHLESKNNESKNNEREVRAASEPAIEVPPTLEESANATHQSRPPVARRPAGEEGQRGLVRRL